MPGMEPSVPAYDKSKWANPLCRLRARVWADKNLTRKNRRHLRIALEQFIAKGGTFTDQERYAAGLFAYWMRMRLEDKLTEADPKDRAFLNMTNAHYKLVLTTKYCLALRTGSKDKGQERMKPPTRQSQSESHASLTESHVR